MDPVRPDFYALVLSAVKATRQVVQELIEQKRYVSRRRIPQLRLTNGGWPGTTAGLLDTGGENDPVEFNQIFGSKVGTLTSVAYSDVPALQAVLDFVESDSQLAGRIWKPLPEPRERQDADRDHDLLERMAANLVFDIAERAIALGCETNEEIKEIYLQREASVVRDTLEVEIVVPIVLVNLNIDRRLQLSETTWIERLRDSDQIVRAPYVSDPNFSCNVAAAATHAVVLGGVSIRNLGLLARLVQPSNDISFDAIDEVCQALAIQTGDSIGYAQVLLRPIGWSDGWLGSHDPLQTLISTRNYPQWYENAAWNLQMHVTEVDHGQLATMYKNLSRGSKEVKLAARRHSMSFRRQNDDDLILDVCIGIEALVGSENSELLFRMSLRAAFVLARSKSEPWDAHRVKKLMSKVYAYRSAVAHGADKPKLATMEIDGQSHATAAVARLIVNSLLKDLLLAETPWSPEWIDKEILDSFNARQPREDTE